MRNIITSTLQRVINKTKGFSAKLVEDHIQYHVAVKGPNQFLNVYVSIVNGVIIEIESDYSNYKMGFGMDMSLEDIVRHVLLDIKHIDMHTPFFEDFN